MIDVETRPDTLAECVGLREYAAEALAVIDLSTVQRAHLTFVASLTSRPTANSFAVMDAPFGALPPVPPKSRRAAIGGKETLRPAKPIKASHGKPRFQQGDMRVCADSLAPCRLSRLSRLSRPHTVLSTQPTVRPRPAAEPWATRPHVGSTTYASNRVDVRKAQ